MQSRIRIIVSGQIELEPPRTEQRRGVKDRLLLVFVTTIFSVFLELTICISYLNLIKYLLVAG